MCERDIRAAVGVSRYCQAFRGALLTATVGVLAMSLVSDAAVADLLLTPDGGNAGIGTTTPTRKLTVVDDDGVQSGAHWIGEFSGETSELLLGYSADGTAVKNARIQSSGDLPLAIGISGADDALWIAADGNIGIGSTNPSRRMTVVDDDGVANGVHWIGELAGQGTQLLLGYAADGSAVTNMRILSANSFPLSLGTSAANDAVWITADGEVGIGTTSPARPLTVKDDDGTSSGAHWIGEFAGEGSQLFIGYVGDGSAVTNMRVLSANSVPLALGTSGANDAIWIKSNGDVGIGTTSPQFLLHVNGSAGKPGGGSWSASSDRRLKKNVTVLTGALDRLAKLQGVNYQWRNPA